MTKKQLFAGLMAGSVSLLGLYIETSLAKKMLADTSIGNQQTLVAPHHPIIRNTNSHTDKTQTAWEEALAKNRESTKKEVDAFEHDGFYSEEQEAIFAGLSKGNHVTYAQTGFSSDAK